MPVLKIDRIISFSSEDKVHVANNLLGSNIALKWKCASPGEKHATVCFQLEKASLITGIDIGNEHSSYIEVLVSRSGETDNNYKSFLVMSSFMSAIESRQSTNINTVRMFKKDDFSKPECDEKWDRIKMVCTQPFNRHVQYGLSFVKFHSNTANEKDNFNIGEIKLGKFTLRPESPIDLQNGSLFARRKEFQVEKDKKPISAATAIRTATSSLLNDSNSSPVRSPKLFLNGLRNSTPKTTNKDVSLQESTPKPRNRNELFYTEDEEKPNTKIDRLIEQKNAAKLKLMEESKNSPQPKTKMKITGEAKVKAETEKTRTPNKLSKDQVCVNKPDKESGKRKLQDTVDKSPKKMKPIRITKPFEKLLEGVVLVISGIQNPDRATLRGKILEMGAKYKADWDSTCTHLVCAFMNTPKFNQVKGVGKIVTSKWVDECFLQRKKLPWRRYALDKHEKKKDESEDEIWEKVEEVSSYSPQPKESTQQVMYEDIMEQASDTEDIIEQIQRVTPHCSKKKQDNTPLKNKDIDPLELTQAHSSKKAKETVATKNKHILTESTAGCSKDNSDDSSTEIKSHSKVGDDKDVYSAETDTDEETVERKQQVKNKPFDFFKNKHFFIDTNFEDYIEELLRNYIFIHEGSLVDDPIENIDYIICGKEEAQNLSAVNTKAICVLPDWIVDCHKCRQFIPPDEYFVL